MIRNVMSLKSRIQTRSSLEEIITSGNEVLKDFEADMPVGFRLLGNTTWETAESNVIVMQNADY